MYRLRITGMRSTKRIKTPATRGCSMGCDNISRMPDLVVRHSCFCYSLLLPLCIRQVGISRISMSAIAHLTERMIYEVIISYKDELPTEQNIQSIAILSV